MWRSSPKPESRTTMNVASMLKNNGCAAYAENAALHVVHCQPKIICHTISNCAITAK